MFSYDDLKIKVGKTHLGYRGVRGVKSWGNRSKHIEYKTVCGLMKPGSQLVDKIIKQLG